MFFNRSSKNELYHPSLGRAQDWAICHVTLGIKNYKELGEPTGFGDVAPAWYEHLSEASLEAIWQKEEEYLVQLLQWIDSRQIVKSFISGADQTRERKMLEQFGVPAEGYFKWSSELIGVVPDLNIDNLYLEAKDNSALILYESDSATIFIRDPNKTTPDRLRLASVTSQDFTH